MEVLALAAVIVLLVYLVVPWVNMARINSLTNEVAQLRAILRQLQSGQTIAVQQADIPAETAAPVSFDTVPLPAMKAPEAAESLQPMPSQPKPRSFEQQLGSRLSVWAGGLALALAGFFLVKYSIQAGLLTPPIRIALGGAFGLGLIQAGRVVHRSGMADGTRIAQALIGAAIADLYGTIYAATTLYGLVLPPIGFTGMVVVTSAAVALSLRYGLPIAVLSMAGGFLTPAMISSDHPSAPLLFIYLLCLTGGLIAVFARRSWWWVASVAVFAAFAWVLVWLAFGAYEVGDSLWLCLYLASTVAIIFHYADETPALTPANTQAKRYLAPVSGIAAALLMALVANRESFRPLDWGLYALLSAAAIALAALRPSRYRLLPFVTLAVSIAMLLAWKTPDYGSYGWVVAVFAALHCGAGYVLYERSRRPVWWLALTAVASLGYYLTAWYTLRDVYAQQIIGFPIWGATAFLAATIAVETTRRVALHFTGSPAERSHLLAIASGTATAFIAIGLTIELHGNFLPVAIAGEVLALAWITRSIDWQVLRYYAAALTIAFAGLLLSQFALLIQIALYSLLELRADFGGHVQLVERPLFQLAIPATMFACASVPLRRRHDDLLVKCLEGLAACLAGLAAFYLTRTLFHARQLFVTASFVERGVNTNVLFVCGLAALWVGRVYGRKVVAGVGMALAGIALFRIVYFDLVLSNPLWSPQSIGALPLFNGLLLPYGFPLLWISLLASETKRLGKPQIATALRMMLPLLAFALITLEVAQLFRGYLLTITSVGDAEKYTYSAAWLLLGILLLFLGTLRHDRLLRIASLPVMLLTIGKVFLYDASELDGLYRVFSFLGLGFALLGLSWFYRRFVFIGEELPSAATS